MNDVKELKDNELKQAAGGDDFEFAIPDVVGWYVEDAVRELNGLGYSCNVEYDKCPIPKDTVTDTNPPAGCCVEPPFDVTVYVSEGL